MSHVKKHFRYLLAGLALVALLPVSAAWAHEVRPAYLELKETAPGRFNILWRTPMLSGMRLPVVLKFPDDVQNVKEPIVEELTDSLVERRWIDARPGGLAGKRIEFVGLQGTITDVLVRVERLDGSSQVTRVLPSSPSFVVEATPRRFEVARTYLVLGIEHILTGIDHLLFVSGLLLVGERNAAAACNRKCIHTFAHSYTDARDSWDSFTCLPLRSKPSSRSAFCLSLMKYSAKDANPSGLAQRKPWLVAFSFGLLHGLGFAGWPQCRRSACSSYPACTWLLQRRGRGWPLFLRGIGAVNHGGAQTLDVSIAHLVLAHRTLRYRQLCFVLADCTSRGVLEVKRICSRRRVDMQRMSKGFAIIRILPLFWIHDRSPAGAGWRSDNPDFCGGLVAFAEHRTVRFSKE